MERGDPEQRAQARAGLGEAAHARDGQALLLGDRTERAIRAMKLVALTAALVACRGDGGRRRDRDPHGSLPAAPVPGPTSSPDAGATRAQSGASPACGEGWDDSAQLWNEARQALTAAIDRTSTVHVEDEIAVAFRNLARRDKGLTARVFPAGAARRVVATTYECGALAWGGRLWLVSQGTAADHWDITGELSAGDHAEVFRPRADVFALLGTRWGTQRRISTLQIARAVDDHWQVLFSRSDLSDLVAHAGGAFSFDWSERPRSFGQSVDGALHTFEGRIDDAGLRVVVDPKAPWLDALDAWCRASHSPSRRELCNTDTYATGARVAGRFAAVTLSGRATDVDCRGEAPASWIAEDRRTLIELGADDAGRWRVVDVRSEDRGCATRVPPAARAAGRVVSRAEKGTLIAARSAGVYWTRDGSLVRTGEIATRLSGAPTAVMLDDDGTAYWATDWPTLLRKAAPGSAATTLSELPSHADGLASVGGALFWSSYAAGELYSLDGGRPRRIASGLDQPWGIAAQAGALLVATATGIRRVDPASGRTDGSELPALSPLYVAASGDTVAWTEAGGRVMLAEAGQAVRIIAAGGRPTAVALLGREVVWADASDGTVRQAAF